MVDLLVSAVLGITAGVASGVVGRDTCLVCFCVDIVAASYHLYLLLRYRGVTPRFVCFYSAAASLITLVAVVMALAQWLTKVLELQSSWNVLSLTQAALGVCAALMAGISFVDFMWQLVESFVSRGGGSRETTVAFSVPADAMHDTELLIDIEAELAALPSSAAAGGEPPPPAVGEFDLLAALAELAAGSAMEAPPQEVSVVEQPPPPPDLNALLDDGDGDDNNASGGAYVLDDTEMPVGDDGGVNQRMSVARGNEEMARNLRELARMLGGGHKPKPRDDFF